MEFTKIMVFLMFMVAAFGTSSMSAEIQIDWTLGTNYEEWASNNPLYVNDVIVFHYNPQYNNVYLVNKQDFESCSTTSPIALYASGWDSITLSKAGSYYFFSGYPGNCEKGQKLNIHVQNGDKNGGETSPSPPGQTVPNPPQVNPNSPPGQTVPNTPQSNPNCPPEQTVSNTPPVIPVQTGPSIYPIDTSSSPISSANWLSAISATCVGIFVASCF